MNNEDFFETYGFSIEELNELLKTKQYRQLREKINDINEVDLAEFLEDLDQEQRLLVFRMLHKDNAADVFANLPVEVQAQIIISITDTELKSIVDELYVDDAVDMLEELPATVVRRVLKNATPETRKLINQFLKYPEDSAGSIMTAEYLSLKKEMRVLNAFDYIRTHGQDSETIYVLFVTDNERHLEGIVTVKDLLMHPYETRISDIMDENIIKCTTTDDQEEVAELFNRYDLISLAVTDQE
ncbi:MAG: magnesium transporter, partial [Lachnospiraceae bacterium]|nr:magnesium transporter [Lachnospiraceae bacterium]